MPLICFEFWLPKGGGARVLSTVPGNVISERAGVIKASGFLI